MKLFLALMRRYNMPPGHIYRGKRRIVDPVHWEHKQMLRNEFEIEERNMFLLRHPYLTKEQSSGHSKALNKQETKFEIIKNKPKNFYDNVTIESRLGHVRFKEPWD